MEKTLIIIKPDAFERKVVSEIFDEIEKKGWKMIDIKVLTPTLSQISEHYIEHKGKHFYENLLKYMTNGTIMVMIWEGDNIISEFRKMVPYIRQRWSEDINRDVIHGSDSLQAAEHEMGIWFYSAHLLQRIG